MFPVLFLQGLNTRGLPMRKKILDSKICNTCNELVMIKKFYLNKKSIDGFDYSCIVCRKKYQNDYYLKNRKIISERNKKNREKLSDAYIKKLIVANSNLSHSDIPKELIQAKRQHLELKRYLLNN